MSKKALLSTATAVLVVFGSMAAIASATDETAAPGGSDPSSSVTTPVESGDDTSSEAPATSDDTSSEAPATSDDTSDTDTPAAKPIEVKPIEVAEEVKPGEAQVIKTEAGEEVTVSVAADDEALAGTTVNISNSSDVAAVNTAIEAVVPATAEASVKEQVQKAVDAVASGDAFMLDISFTKGKDTVQPGKSVSITIPAPADLADVKEIFVYHVSANGLEKIDASITDGKITLTSDKFSPFIISKTALTAAEDEDKPAESDTSKGDDDTSKGDDDTSKGDDDTSNAVSDGDSNTPGGSESDGNGNGDGNGDGNGGDQANTGIALAVAPVVLAAGAVVAFAVKKRK